MKSLMEMLQQASEDMKEQREFNSDISREVGLDEEELERHIMELKDLYPIEMKGLGAITAKILHPLDELIAEVSHVSWILPESLADFFIKAITTNLRRMTRGIEKSYEINRVLAEELRKEKQ